MAQQIEQAAIDASISTLSDVQVLTLYNYCVRNDVDRPTRKEYLVLALQKWISNESEMKQFLEKQFKTLTDNSKIAEADRINEIILCVDKRLKLANRKMLEYKAVDYDSYYIIYDQKELHEKYESMEKDGFKIEMC